MMVPVPGNMDGTARYLHLRMPWPPYLTVMPTTRKQVAVVPQQRALLGINLYE
jgi:hypothetical protein